ncbi:MAG: ATP-dependent helicase HrpB [Verrucomicrobiota bacterium]|nr:ATP-dependent helicase HrpB [Verrucomicrobiota bacterium]
MMDFDLPIYAVEKEALAALDRHARLIVQAPTGSGKSTQIPQMLLDHGRLGNGQVVILQPRRLAARLLANRVAQECGVRVGQEVGYQIRFEDVSSKRTRIKYVTEGILLRRMLADPNLGGVSAVIFDEFHERHLCGDISLARALQLQAAARPDLKILVMSATLAPEQLERYLDPCGRVSSEGRVFPIAVEYLPKPAKNDAPVWELATREFERLAGEGAEGDVLVFMPGAYEINRAMGALRRSPAAAGCLILPLHGELATRDQDAAVARYDRRKIIVSTNVAESSLTIDGIRLVIDSGLARIPRFDPNRGINTLLVEKISRASADQRAGRAGRSAPGRCIRLWTEREHGERRPQELPEIRRLDLAEAVLTLKASGVDDVRAFHWLEPPEPKSLDRAELLLKDLDALDSSTGAVTPTGRRMLSFPVHPRYSRMLLAAEARGCVKEAALIAALTQGRNLLVHGAGRDARKDRELLLGEEDESDFFALMRAWQYAEQKDFDLDACRRVGIHAQTARQTRPLLEFFLRIAREEGLRILDGKPSSDAVRKCVLAGFSDQLARRAEPGSIRCLLVRGRKGRLARESVVRRSLLLVAAEVREVEGKDRGDLNVLLSLATAVNEEWLRELFPGDFSENLDARFDSTAKRVVARRQTLFRDLALDSKIVEPPPAEAAAGLLAQEVIKGALELRQWDHGVDQWILRVNCLAGWYPELRIPVYDDEARRSVADQICRGAVSHKDIRDRPVRHAVKSRLSPAQQGLVDKYAPERIELSNGRNAKLTYVANGSPRIALRIQELYGVKETPTIAGGRVPVVVHILAPNQRPVQITRDMARFWTEHYPRIKQECQRKYSKHEWK